VFVMLMNGTCRSELISFNNYFDYMLIVLYCDWVKWRFMILMDTLCISNYEEINNYEAEYT
jgi:hypothetical protein